MPIVFMAFPFPFLKRYMDSVFFWVAARAAALRGVLIARLSLPWLENGSERTVHRGDSR
jgi:hypothetical protein